MTRWEFRLPDIGEGVTEGEIVGWLVKPGDTVGEAQPVVEMMTDKATVTITAPRAGTVVETRGRIGEIVPVHSVLLVFELDALPPGVPSAELHANGSRATVDGEDSPGGASSSGSASGSAEAEREAGEGPPA